MYPSGSQYKSWTSRSSAGTSSQHPSAFPGPMPGTPHLHPVSLPHPNHQASSSSSQHYAQHPGPSGIRWLNPLLSVSGGAPQLYYNVARDVRYIQFQSGSETYLDQPAINPPCPQLVLFIPSLPPWSTIEVRNPRGVTARDVLVRIREVLDRSVSTAEMNEMVRYSPTYASASDWFRARSSADPREYAQGVKRIDFLGQTVFFAGLFQSTDGRGWEIRFAPLPK